MHENTCNGCRHYLGWCSRMRNRVYTRKDGKKSVQLIGIDSPGLTTSLAIAEYVQRMID